MKEAVILKKIREYLKIEYGCTVHKFIGTPMTERGHADLYGTTPDGRAYFIEVKSPTAKKDIVRTQYQRIFLYREQLNGALVGFASSLDDVDQIMAGVDTLDIYDEAYET